MGRAVGIDLGTTYSAVAVIDGTGVPVIVPNDEGAKTTPSVVLFEVAAGADRPVVGTAARRQAAARPDDTVEYVKRHIGDASWRFDSPGDRQYRAEEISAIILRSLVSHAERALGESIEDVVITVPAYFDDSRRTATKQAGTIAGLNVLRVLNEPTAAALSFGLSTDEDGIALVYDLGGGTFDVTILGIEGKTFTVLATDGDRNLGGFDWDNAIMKHVVAELEKTHGVTGLYDDTGALAVLRAEAERAKRALSETEHTTIPFTHGGERYDIEFTRADFETATASLLRRTQDLVEDTLDASGLDWDDIGSVLLVGGSTRMPAVRALVRRLSGCEPVAGVDPDEAVALGAAVQAAIEGASGTLPESLEGLTVEDVTSHALGTIALDTEGRERNFVVIDKNEKIPATGSNVLTTTGPRARLTVTVTQGDDPDPAFVTVIGDGVITLSEEWPEGTDFALIYRFDIEQTVSVQVYRLPDESFVGSFAIDRVANLSEKSVTASAEKIDELVFSETPTLTAIARPALELPSSAQILRQETAPRSRPGTTN